MTLTPTEQEWLKTLLDGLEAKGTNPIVLRNYEDLPGQIGNDLDIFVDPRELEVASAHLTSSLAATGGQVVHVHERAYFTAIWLRVNPGGAILHIDLYPGAASWKGIDYIDRDELIRGRQDYVVAEGFVVSVPLAAHQVMVMLFSSVLWGGFYKRAYVQRMRELLDDENSRSEVGRLTSAAFGSELGEDMIEANYGFEGAKLPRVGRLRSALLRRSAVKRPLPTLLGVAKHWFWEFKCHFWSPPGKRLVYPRQEEREAKRRFEEIVGEYGSVFRSASFIPMQERQTFKDRLKTWHSVASNSCHAVPGRRWEGDWEMKNLSVARQHP